jgi:hypothetical protein
MTTTIGEYIAGRDAAAAVSLGVQVPGALDLPSHIRSILAEEDVVTAEDAVRLGKKGLMRISGIGPKYAEVILKAARPPAVQLYEDAFGGFRIVGGGQFKRTLREGSHLKQFLSASISWPSGVDPADFRTPVDAWASLPRDSEEKWLVEALDASGNVLDAKGGRQ